MTKIKDSWLGFSLRTKAILIAAFFIVIFMAITGYTILSREKALYLRDRENQARALVETAGINFTNAILYQEVGLIEETGVVDRYITDLLIKDKTIYTIIIFDNQGIVKAHCHLIEHGKFYKDANEIIGHQATFVREVEDKARGPILEAMTPLMVGARRLATLRIEFSLKNFYEKLADLGKRIFLLTILAISGSIFLVVIGINAMTGPIRRLSKAMDIIDYGRYENFSERLRQDEIGHLQKSFTGMMRRLKDADLQWEKTFNSITDIVTIHDKDFRIIKANLALAKRLGVTVDELKGRMCWEVFHNSDGPCLKCPHVTTLKMGQVATLEIEYPPMGGIFLATTYPIFNEEGRVTGTVHVAKDITEEKKLQEKLIQSEKMVAMGQMASGIAHQINNPLNSILGYSTYILENLDDKDPNKDELKKIASATTRCKEIVKRFLDFAREAPGRMGHIDIKEVIGEALSLCYHPIFSQKIKVTKVTDPDLYVNADKRQIEEAFVNIILNACDAMPAGGELIIEARKEDTGIKIKISDTGCGITQENLHRIFDPFFTTKEPGKGTGLGLAVTHTIITNHGGAISCESIEGKGTTFTIILSQVKDIDIKGEFYGI